MSEWFCEGLLRTGVSTPHYTPTIPLSQLHILTATKTFDIVAAPYIKEKNLLTLILFSRPSYIYNRLTHGIHVRPYTHTHTHTCTHIHVYNLAYTSAFLHTENYS